MRQLSRLAEQTGILRMNSRPGRILRHFARSAKNRLKHYELPTRALTAMLALLVAALVSLR